MCYFASNCSVFSNACCMDLSRKQENETMSGHTSVDNDWTNGRLKFIADYMPTAP